MKSSHENQLIDVLPNFQGIFFSQSLKRKLYKEYKIISKNIGIDKSTKSMRDFIIEPYLLDHFSVAFLLEVKPTLFNSEQLSSHCQSFYQTFRTSLQFLTFKQLKDKYFLLNGHKFGSLFLAYDQNPQKNHAKSLIFCGKQSQKQSKINHMTRLAQIAKKQCLFVYKKQNDDTLRLQKLERQKQQNIKSDKKKKKIQQKDHEKIQQN